LKSSLRHKDILFILYRPTFSPTFFAESKTKRQGNDGHGMHLETVICPHHLTNGLHLKASTAARGIIHNQPKTNP
jgi:hypothetical protein